MKMQLEIFNYEYSKAVSPLATNRVFEDIVIDPTSCLMPCLGNSLLQFVSRALSTTQRL